MFTSEYENAINAQFAKNLRHFLDRYNYTQLDFAKKMNVSAATVSNWCNGTKSPRMDKVDIMCSIFNCRRSDLLEANPVVANDSIDLIATQKKVAHNFKKIINGYGIDLSNLSADSGVSEYAIKHYLNGDIIPSETNAKLLGSVLKVNHLWLMGFDIQMKQSLETDGDLAQIIDMYRDLSEPGRKKVYDRVQELMILEDVAARTEQPDAHEIHKDAIQYVRDIDAARNKKDNIG